MSAIRAGGCMLVEELKQSETPCGLMQHSPLEIKEKLLKALDKEHNVVDMGAVVEVITMLESTPITKEELEVTRLGRLINDLRRRTNNEVLAKRAKDLVRRWRDLILPQENGSSGGPSGPGPGPIPGRLASPGVRIPASRLPVVSPAGSLPSSTSTSPGLHSTRPLTPTKGPNVGNYAPNAEVASKTHASNKRLRKEKSPTVADSVSKRLRGANHVVNGADEASRDSFWSELGAESAGSPDPPVITPTVTTRKGRKKANSKLSRRGVSGAGAGVSGSSVTDQDVLKQKFAIIARTPKVKTTQQLVEDLARRSGSPTAAVLGASTSPALAGRVADDGRALGELFGKQADPGEVTRTKSVLMAKFLQSEPEYTAESPAPSPSPVPASPDTPLPTCAPSPCGTTSVDDILARLPPIVPSEIVWETDNDVEEEAEEKKVVVTDQDLKRLHTEEIEGVNGTRDRFGNFREWHEMVTCESFQSEDLHILPYTVID